MLCFFDFFMLGNIPAVRSDLVLVFISYCVFFLFKRLIFSTFYVTSLDLFIIFIIIGLVLGLIIF